MAVSYTNSLIDLSNTTSRHSHHDVICELLLNHRNKIILQSKGR